MDLQFADNVKVIMKYYNYKQARFAILLGTINQKTLSTYVNGAMPNLETVIRIRALTGLSIDSLLFSKILVSDLPSDFLKNPSEIPIVKETIISKQKSKTIEERLRIIEERLDRIEGKQLLT